MGYYSSIKKNEIFSFVATWMGLEGFMLCAIVRERQRQQDFTYTWILKTKQMNKQNKTGTDS